MLEKQNNGKKSSNYAICLLQHKRSRSKFKGIRYMSNQVILSQVPSGNDFMKGTSINFLRKACRKENNAKAKIRLKAAILRKQQKTYTEISTGLDVLPSTLSYWLQRMNLEGIKASHHRKHPGKKSFLSYQQLISLQKELMQDPQTLGFAQSVWTTRMIIQHVNQRYGIKYTARGIRDLLHRIGFVSKKPRPIHYKSASKAQKKSFKKTQEGQSEDTQNQDTPRFAWTSHPTE